MAIKIPFVADVAKFLSGTKDVTDGLDDVADSLDDITKAGSDVDRKVGSDLDGVARAADDSADKISRSFKDAFNDVEAAGRTSSRKVKADVDDVGHKGSATLQEFSSEAKQNVAESVSSFNGSASSAVDAIQSTFGGLVSALGPAGLVGAAAVGVGIGFARSLFEKSREEAEKLRESIGTIFDELRENQGTIGEAFQADQMADLLRDTEEFKKLFGSDIPTVMKTFGDSFGTVMQGMTGDSEDVADAQAAVNQTIADAKETFGVYVDDLGNVRIGNAQVEEVLGRTNLALQKHADAVTGGVAANQALAEATKGFADETGDSAEALVSENEQLRISAGLKGDAVANELDMRDALEDVTKARKDNGASLSKNTEAGRDNLRAIKHAMDGIKAYGDALVDNGAKSGTATKKMEDQEKVLVQKVAKAFKIGDTAAAAYIKTLGGIPPAKDTKVTVSDHGTAKDTANTIKTTIPDHMDLPVKVTYKPSDTVLKQIQRHLNSYTFKVDVDARPGQPT